MLSRNNAEFFIALELNSKKKLFWLLKSCAASKKKIFGFKQIALSQKYRAKSLKRRYFQNLFDLNLDKSIVDEMLEYFTLLNFTFITA